MKTRIIVPIALFVVVAGIAALVLLETLSKGPDSTLDTGTPPPVEEPAPAEPVAPDAGETPLPPPPAEPKDPEKVEIDEEVIEDKGPTGESLLTGTVLAADSGDPVEGARVWVSIQGVDAPVAATLTDGRGRFMFRGLDMEPTYGLFVTKEGYGEGRGQDLKFDPEIFELEVMDIRLEAGGTLAGTVSTDAGSLLPGAEIQIHPLKKNAEGITYTDRWTTYHAQANETGSFENRFVPAGRFRVMAEAEGYARKILTGVEVTAGNRTEVDFRLAREAELRGTVRDNHGMPVVGARLSGSYIGKGGPFELPRTVTEEDGSFRIPHMPPGRCTLKVDAIGYGTQIRLAVPVPSTDLEFVLVLESGVIEGRVEGPAGPLDGFEVKYYEEKPGNYQMAALAVLQAKTKTFEEAKGLFRIDRLTAGKYTVEVYAEGCLGNARSGVEVTEGAVTSGVDFKLGELHPLRGTVTRKTDGAPVAGATVVVNLVIKGPFGEIPFRASDVKTETDAAGFFELTRLKEGSLSISVIHPEYGKISKSGIQIKAGEAPAEMKIEIREGGRVAGTVRDPEGRGVMGDYVVIQNPQDPSNRTELETGEDGTYHSERLAPGMYQVIHVDGKDTTKIKVKFATIKSGETVTVDFGEARGCRLHGKVFDAGKPVPTSNVSLIRVGESLERKGEFGVSVTNERGEYEIKGVQPGRYYIFVQTGQIEGSGRARTVRVAVTVGEDDREIQTDVEFPNGAFAGFVRDGASGDLLSGATVIVMQADIPDDVRSFEEIISHLGGQALTDEAGAFEVGGLEAGRYTVTVVKEGYASETLDAKTLGRSQRLVLSITLGPEAQVTG
ncbi:MAG: carboxypeptidase regulatory-like domain-containing protein, partial [Planctomycetota bacterium]